MKKDQWYGLVLAGGGVLLSATARRGIMVALAAVALLAGVATAVAAQEYYWLGFPAALNTNAATDAGDDEYSKVRTDGAGTWVAMWRSEDDLGGTIGTDADILVSRSTDNGATWTAPAALNTNAATDAGGDTLVDLSTDRAGNWVAVWQSDDDLGGTIGTDSDILVARSTDNGATWSAPAPLNTNAATDSGDDHWGRLTTDGAGAWVAAWLSYDDLGGTIGTDSDILVARSTDNGATWTAPAVLNTSAATDSGNDEIMEVTTDGAGNWVAVWHSSDDLGGTIGVDWDILVARSTDNGATWTAPAALNTNAATDAGGDFQVGLSTNGTGDWIAVWASYDDLGGTIGTDSDILVARSTDNGATWTAPAALNTIAATDAGDDSQPKVATDDAGTWVAVWHSTEDLGGTIGTDRDILVAWSADGGSTWTAPAALNANAATDSGADVRQSLATDGVGTWVVIWNSREDLGGTIGSDWDILVAVGSCAPVPATGCRAAEKRLLLIKDKAPDTRDKLVWKWIKGEATSQQEFADPTGTADYALCLYAGTAATPVAGAAVPAHAVNWQPIGTKGYRYKDKVGTQDGIQRIVLKGSTDNKAKVVVKGRGDSLRIPGLPLELPVTVQLLNSQTGICWEGAYDTGDVKKNQADQFKARGRTP